MLSVGVRAVAHTWAQGKLNIKKNSNKTGKLSKSN